MDGYETLRAMKKDAACAGDMPGGLDKLKPEPENPPGERYVWRRVHRPEEYVFDVSKFIAREIKIPHALVLPALPIASALLRKWDDAAVEHTQYVVDAEGNRILRTFFKIHNYSNSSVYTLLEDLLQRMGVGRRMRNREPEVDFMWLVLGGVLTDYATCACVSEKSLKTLLDFRLKNSDYLTATTWFHSRVEIANLESGKVDILELPAKDIECIVSWAVDYQMKCCGKKSCEIASGHPECVEFDGLMRKYHEVTRGGM